MVRNVSDEPLKRLSELASDAHARLQKECADINPVVGIRRGMRDNGIPADAMTIDCLASGKRIVLVLHDHKPGILLYQFTRIEESEDAPWQQVPQANVSSDLLRDWMRAHFSADPPPVDTAH